MGIEPTSSAWEAEVLPLNYTRHLRTLFNYHSMVLTAQQFVESTRIAPGKTVSRIFVF